MRLYREEPNILLVTDAENNRKFTIENPLNFQLLVDSSGIIYFAYSPYLFSVGEVTEAFGEPFLGTPEMLIDLLYRHFNIKIPAPIDQTKAPAQFTGNITTPTLTGNTVSFSWPIPTDTGLDKDGKPDTIKEYKITFTSTDGTKLAVISTTNSINRQLTFGKTYSIELVIVTNSGKESQPRTFSNAIVIPSAAEVPSIPINLKLQGNPTKREIVVIWNAPTNPGKGSDGNTATILDYKIGYKAKGIQNFTEVSTGIRTLLSLTNLTPDTEYEFRVKAINVSGESPYTSIFTTQTLSDLNPPTAVSNLRATAISSTEVELTFTAPTNTGTNSKGQALPITEYRIGYGTQRLTSTTTTRKITGLRPFTDYVFTVRAFNGNQESPSETVSVKTASAKTLPDAPINIRKGVLEDGNTMLSLVWEIPDNIGTDDFGVASSTIEYEVTVTDGTNIFTKTVTNHDALITGLTRNTSYNITVITKTSNGNSVPSAVYTNSTTDNNFQEIGISLPSRLIPDAQLTASSNWNGGEAFRGRIGDPSPSGWGTSAPNQAVQWWQVDVNIAPVGFPPTMETIGKIAIQSRTATPDRFIKTFKLSYSVDGTIFTEYNDGEILNANTALGQLTEVEIAPTTARYFRINPVEVATYATGKFEFYRVV